MTDFRVTFSKTGPLVFISHLDLTHTFVRALNRAELPLRYSEGFNPHPKIVFALPLSVGMAGLNELCDIGLKEDISAEVFREKLSDVLPPYIEIKSVEQPGVKLKQVVSAQYDIAIEKKGISDKISMIMERPEMHVIKRSKSGEKDTDIKPQIISYSLSETDDGTVMTLTVDASPDKYLNPTYVITALENEGVLDKHSCTFTRKNITLGK